jgi:hypothetical protein
MNEVNIHNYWSQQHQSERNKASDKEKQTANDLKYGNHVKVMAQEKGLGEVAEQPRRGRRHRNELQKNVRTEHNENEPEKYPSDDGSDFHVRIVR